MRIDLEKIKKQRKENVKIIYEKLKNIFEISFLFEYYTEEDCLLFVPILLKNEIRNDLRSFLTNENVFLPVHWPLEKKINNIFEKELSLVCDQRYKKEQIEEYIELIINYFNKK